MISIPRVSALVMIYPASLDLDSMPEPTRSEYGIETTCHNVVKAGTPTKPIVDVGFVIIITTNDFVKGSVKDGRERPSGCDKTTTPILIDPAFRSASTRLISKLGFLFQYPKTKPSPRASLSKPVSLNLRIADSMSANSASE